MRIVLARAGMWAAMSGYNRDGETRGRANRNCTLVRREIGIYERYWSRGHTIFWDRLEPTALRRWGLKLAERGGKKWEEASGDRGGAQAGRAAASVVGQWRSL